MAVPDKAQLPVWARALEDCELVYMAVPKLATLTPFHLLDPGALDISPLEAAASRVVATVAPTVEIDALRPVDVVVLGSAAVNRDGARIGKGDFPGPPRRLQGRCPPCSAGRANRWKANR
ncbi:5-formyltetrahydrofolate cyclo-ligase [Streptomyces azureus]|uniref:5-formyltetrahydrofolate cyclo-ligase n=1 Tax=Streptomyces azureus TaxID=146537 RepID=A0A0K8PVE5_STRAJ|nr:5-formyltetrahydrofolate cyclo-ligase [Streptomyces azureus]